MRAPERFSEGKSEAAKQRGSSPRGFVARGKSQGSPHTAPQHSVGTQGTLLRDSFFHTAPRIFNSCTDYQNHEVHFLADWLYPPADWLYPSADLLYPPVDCLNPLGHIDIELANKASPLANEASPLMDEASPLLNEASPHMYP